MLVLSIVSNRRNKMEAVWTGMHGYYEIIRFGFKSKKQLPWFMIWKEYRYNNEVEFARIIFKI